jgi:hypothetical protein
MAARGVMGAVGLVVFGLVFAGVGGYLYVEEQAAIESSDPVNATVVASEVVVETDRDSDGDVDRSYYPEITYRYEVGDETYESANVVPGPGRVSKGRQWAQRVVNDHPAGASVTAYVDRTAPNRAFLVKERQTLFHAVFVGVGALTAIAGVVSAGRTLVHGY